MIGVYFNMNPTTSSQISAGLIMKKSTKRIKITNLTGKKPQMTDLSDKESVKIVGGGVPGAGGVYSPSCPYW